MESLLDAALNGNLGKVQSLIQAGIDINSIGRNGHTALHYSALNGHMDIVKTLIAAGADVHARRSSGWTPLHCSSMQGHIDIVKTLIAAGADVNAKRKVDGHTPLHYSAMHGHADIMKTLIAAGADIDGKMDSNKTRPLHISAKNGHMVTVKILITAGTDVNAKDEKGWTALHYIVDNGYLDIVKILFASGADICVKDNNDETAFDCAFNKDYGWIVCSKYDMIKALIKYTLLYQCKSKLEYGAGTVYQYQIGNECEEQVKIMKETRLGGSCISFYDFVIETDENKLALYTFEESFGIKNDLVKTSCIEKFPLYAEDIVYQFNKGSERANLLHKSQELMIRRCFGNTMPPDIIRKICEKMSNDDLKNFLIMNDITNLVI